MNTITITQAEFEAQVMAATSSNANVYDKVSPRFTVAQEQLETDLLGSLDISENSVLLQLAKRYIAMKAFMDIIPQLDLVLTPTGFGIVSNENVAPASKERVSALKERIADDVDDTYDKLLVGIIELQDSSWSSSSQAESNVDEIIYTGEQLQKSASDPTAHRTALVRCRTDMARARQYISKHISPLMYLHLLEQIRTASLTSSEKTLLMMLRIIMGQFIRHSEYMVRGIMNDVMYFIENNIDDFSTYADSATYEANHTERYENEKTDTTYFWG